MFNGFAFGRPFCQAIKVGLTGVEFKLKGRGARWGKPGAGSVCAGSGTMLRMGSINGYICAHTLGAFLIVLVSLTAVIWVNAGVA